MIFDEISYSPLWAANFPVQAAAPSPEGLQLPNLQTHSTLGAVKDATDAWRFEPGLGIDFEISHSLLLACGFQITFGNDQVYQLLHLEPGVLIGRLPARATPELFAPDQETQEEQNVAFLEQGEFQIGLLSQVEGADRIFALCVHRGDRESCRAQLQKLAPQIPVSLESTWKEQITLREKWSAQLPEYQTSENPGLAIERLLTLIEPAAGGFSGSWIRDPARPEPVLSFRLYLSVLPAVAVFAPDWVPEMVNTLLALPKTAQGAWADSYDLDAKTRVQSPSLPGICRLLATLPRELRSRLELNAIGTACQSHLQSFLQNGNSADLPQWPDAETAFTPEVTDPRELRQFDLAALLVNEIEALQDFCGDNSLLESERKQLVEGIWNHYWCPKRKRLLDKTLQGDFAGRVTAAALIPLLWKRLSKNEFAALKQCLQNQDELRAPTGIRQWQPKKEDPVPPPVHPETQHLFLPLLEKLPGESAALLSADWHRHLSEDPECSHPGTAALLLRLIPYASRINPHLERYPAWVRTMEKHRQGIVTAVAAVLLLVPASFGIYFTVRQDYNLTDELQQAGHAETLITMGNLSGAEEVYTKLLENARSDQRKNTYHLERGNIRFKQENYPEALEDYLKAVELDPIGDLFKARWNLAQAYARLERYPEAIQTMQAFIAEYGAELPDFKRRAEHAIRLWQQ